ncbi:MAG: hypothetical protein L6Q57_07645 [Alphaproteobacteria bacterium]|nr:hypothetical protein [Alphaproteobacteria bacterium]
MILCLCHPFSDSQAKAHMQAKGAKVSVSEVYSVCSDGKTPQCCTCLQTLKDMVKSHNRAVAV